MQPIPNGPDRGGSDAPESLRERRRRELRQQLSDAATQMFFERGFDAVLVSDIARACGVTEKTVFNHFRTKEALLVDRWDGLVAAVQERLEDRSTPAVSAVVRVLDQELDDLTSRGTATTDDMRRVVRFGELVSSTPSLFAHRRLELQRLAGAIGTAVAARRNSSAVDPDVQITAEALTGLFTVFYRSVVRHSQTLDAAACRTRVRRDIRKAARRLAAGIED